MKVLALVKDAWVFVRQNDTRTVVAHVTSRDAHPLVQFAKYGACGVAAVIVHNLLAYALGIWAIPWVGDAAAGLTKVEVSNNQILCNLIAFPAGNAVAYGTNALWVFHGGRHSRWREFLFFTGISFFSFVVGLLGGPILTRFGLDEDLAQLGLIITSTLVNFVCRKFLVFKG